jgi:uncharacterized protein (DUF58 family)
MTRRRTTVGNPFGAARPATARGQHPPGMPPRHSYLRPADLRRLKNLLFIARTIVEGYYAGRHRSRFRGHSIEFADYREYCPGDDITDIDWKAFGRTDKLFVKLFEAQTNMVVYPLLDCSASMAYAGLSVSSPAGADAPLSKFEYACYLTAALAFLIVRQGDKTALGLFRERLAEYFAPGGTFGHLYGLLNVLEQARPSGRTNVADALRQAFGTLTQRGLLIVISDFLEDPGPLFEALGLYRHRRFEIILFHILHEQELHLPSAANVRFLDSETNESLATVPADIREDYERRLAKHVDDLRTGCLARRIDYNLVSTATSYYAVLERYLADRSALGTQHW